MFYSCSVSCSCSCYVCVGISFTFLICPFVGFKWNNANEVRWHCCIVLCQVTDIRGKFCAISVHFMVHCNKLQIALQYNAIQCHCNVIQFNTIQYISIHYTALHYNASRRTKLCSSSMCTALTTFIYTTQHNTVLYRTKSH